MGGSSDGAAPSKWPSPGAAARRRAQLRAQQQRRRWGAGGGGGGGGGADGAEGGSDGEVDPYADGSDLSDWSDAEGAGDGGGGSGSSSVVSGAGGDGGGGNAAASRLELRGSDWQSASVAVPDWLARAPATGPAAPAPELGTRRAVPAPGDLLPALAALRLARAPWLAPDAARCRPQRVLAAAALAALRGDVAEGFAPSADGTAITVDPSVTTPALSPGALRALLREFAAAGSAARALARTAERLSGVDAGGGGGSTTAADDAAATPLGLPATPCLRAFGAALSEQLAALNARLAALEQRVRAAADDDADDAGALAAAHRAAAGVIERLRLLEEAVGAALNEAGGGAAQASAALVDSLYRRLAAGDPALTGPAGEGAAGALLHLLLCALMPLVGSLGRWLYGGREGDEAAVEAAGGGGDGDDAGSEAAACGGDGGDFFIVRRRALPVRDPRFWSQAFALAPAAKPGGGAPASADGEEAAAAVACPAFLAPLAADVLSAGKSLRLLRHMRQEQLAAAPLEARALSCGGDDSGGGQQRGAPSESVGGRRQRRAWRDGGDAGGTWAAAAPTAAAPPLELTGRAGAGGARTSAAARLQLAVAAAAARHAEDGAALQRRFADAASALLRAWDAAAPRAEQQPEQQQQQWQDGVLDGKQPASAGCGSRGANDLLGGARDQGPHAVLRALEGAGRQLRCPGALLEAGTGAAELLLGDDGSAGFDEEEQEEEDMEQQQQGARCARPSGRQPGAARAVTAAGAPASLESDAITADGGGDGDASGVVPLSAWGAALRRDLAAADARLLQLAPAECGDVDTADDAMPPPPGDWPAELWPLRRHRRGRRAGGASAPWLSAPLRPQASLAWLLTSPPRAAPPVRVLLERALLAPLRARVAGVGRELVAALLGEWGLEAELRALAGAYLLAAPAAAAWADALLEALEAAGGLGALDAGELTARLDEAAAAAAEGGGGDPLPAPGSLVVSIDAAALEAARAAAAAAGGGGGGGGGSKGSASARPQHPPPRGPSVTELSALRVRHLGSWLLSLVAEPAQLQRYNGALVFLLQLRWARRELDAARLRAAKSRLCSAAMAAMDANERGAAEAAAAARARQLSTPAGIAAAAALGAAGAAGGSSSTAAAGAAAVAAAGAWLPPSGEHLLLLEMGHLVGALQAHVMGRLVDGAWRRLEEVSGAAAGGAVEAAKGLRGGNGACAGAHDPSHHTAKHTFLFKHPHKQQQPPRPYTRARARTQGLAAAATLDDARRRHAEFLEAALRQTCHGSGRGRGATWRHIGHALAPMLDAALRACRAHARLLELRAERRSAADGGDGASGGVVGSGPSSSSSSSSATAAAAAAAALEVAALRGELAAAAAAWRGGRDYLLRVLRSPALQLGGDDGVEALLGALGFNGYYYGGGGGGGGGADEL